MAIGQAVGAIEGVPGESETLRGINGNPLSASVDITISPTVAAAQQRHAEIVATFAGIAPLTLARHYGDEAGLYGQPAALSESQVILHWRDRNAVADVTVYDDSGSVSQQGMTTALYTIADLFSARVAAA